jgi:uncharacterized membrane protein
MRNACLLYVRVVDDKGQGVPKPEILVGHVPEKPREADSYGRYQGPFKGTNDVTVVKEGFESAVEHVQCKDDEELDIKIVMKAKVQ